MKIIWLHGCIEVIISKKLPVHSGVMLNGRKRHKGILAVCFCNLSASRSEKRRRFDVYGFRPLQRLQQLQNTVNTVRNLAESAVRGLLWW
jgi:hypothetical protein